MPRNPKNPAEILLTTNELINRLDGHLKKLEAKLDESMTRNKHLEAQCYTSAIQKLALRIAYLIEKRDGAKRKPAKTSIDEVYDDGKDR